MLTLEGPRRPRASCRGGLRGQRAGARIRGACRLRFRPAGSRRRALVNQATRSRHPWTRCTVASSVIMRRRRSSEAWVTRNRRCLLRRIPTIPRARRAGSRRGDFRRIPRRERHWSEGGAAPGHAIQERLCSPPPRCVRAARIGRGAGAELGCAVTGCLVRVVAPFERGGPVRRPHVRAGSRATERPGGPPPRIDACRGPWSRCRPPRSRAPGGPLRLPDTPRSGS